MRYTQDTFTETVNLGNDLKNGVARRNQGLAGALPITGNTAISLILISGTPVPKILQWDISFGFFPAFSGALNIAEEPFIKITWVGWIC
jgi:hypothetical protein